MYQENVQGSVNTAQKLPSVADECPGRRGLRRGLEADHRRARQIGAAGLTGRLICVDSAIFAFGSTAADAGHVRDPPGRTSATSSVIRSCDHGAVEGPRAALPAPDSDAHSPWDAAAFPAHGRGRRERTRAPEGRRRWRGWRGTSGTVAYTCTTPRGQDQDNVGHVLLIEGRSWNLS